ncbi:MAG TPA: thermonuclease family protein [Tepidisphaeraceae bacterium]|nr:thermonuclease family protein [Tepidisphaeraceae bacterium]
MGLLVISGSVLVDQFWPERRSDADTVQVNLIPGQKAIMFTSDGGTSKATSVFDSAELTSQHGRKTIIKQPKNGGPRKITVRLQGIDAPELHYQPQLEKMPKGVTHPFRQSLGETCAYALHAFVSNFGLKEIPCEVVTRVDKPNDVCDSFGRVVGNVVLLVGGSRIDINHWLIREGWALPGFYNSISKPEILAILAGYQAAMQNNRGLFSKKIMSSLVVPFNANQVERHVSSFKPFSDNGRANFPKFFRRQAERYVRAVSGQAVAADLRGFIATKASDLAIPRDKFLKLTGKTVGKKPRPEFQQLATFLAGNHFPIGPELVYWENDSRLVQAGTNTEIKAW